MKVLLASSKNHTIESLINEYLVELYQFKVEGREKLINMTS